MTVAGQAVVPVDLINIGHWLRLLLGAPTTTGTTNFIHTFGSGAASLPSNAMEIGYPDVPSFDVCTGVRADTLEMDFTPTGAATATLQIIRDWVLRFNAEGPAGLIDRKPPGQPRLLTEVHRQALMATIESGPMPAIHGVVRWRLCDLGQWLWEEFRISVSKQTLSRELRGMGLRKLSARPKHHAQVPDAIETFKKTFPRRWQASRPTKTSASMR